MPDAAKTPLVDICDISIRRGGKSILEHITLAVHAGEIVTLVGPNGAGKTTLINAVLGLIRPDSGSITRQKALRIGYVPQRTELNPLMPLTVGRFMLLAPKSSKSEAQEALTHFGAEHLTEHQVHTLSGGEWQRVLLARATMNAPQLLILDEPARGMDLGAQLSFYETLDALRHRLNCAIMLVSHDLHMVMANTDKVVCIHRHICCHGHPEDIAVHPEFVQMFGNRAAHLVAFYNHEHDHSHGWGSAAAKNRRGAHTHEHAPHEQSHGLAHTPPPDATGGCRDA